MNQHASICGGFGPCPSDGYNQWDAMRRNSVTGAARRGHCLFRGVLTEQPPAEEIFPVCNCKRKKYFNDEAALTELNKFDDLMRRKRTVKTSHQTKFKQNII